MNGIKRPTIFRFVDNLKKDESIARGKIISCLAAKPAPPQKKADAIHDASVKLTVGKFAESMNAIQKAAEEVQQMDEIDSDDETGNECNATATVPTESPREIWLKSPAIQLLAAIAHYSGLINCLNI